MKWIRVASQIADDAKVWRIAEHTGADPFAVVGHLITLWGVMTEQAKDGDLSRIPDAQLEQWAKWSGKGRKPGRFAAAVRDALCTDAGILGAWEKYQGAAIREYEADRRRKSGGKAPPADRPTVAPNDSGIPPENHRNSGGIPAATSTSTSTTEGPSSSAGARAHIDASAAAEDPAVGELRAQLDATYHADVDALLGDLAPTQQRAWTRSIMARLSGLHPPVVSPSVVGEAIRQYLANGTARSWKHFDAYLRREAQPAPLRGHAGASLREDAARDTYANSLAAVDAVYAVLDRQRRDS